MYSYIKYDILYMKTCFVCFIFVLRFFLVAEQVYLHMDTHASYHSCLYHFIKLLFLTSTSSTFITIFSTEFTTDPSICYSDQQLLKVLPETTENECMCVSWVIQKQFTVLLLHFLDKLYHFWECSLYISLKWIVLCLRGPLKYSTDFQEFQAIPFTSFAPYRKKGCSILHWNKLTCKAVTSVKNLRNNYLEVCNIPSLTQMWS